VTLNNKCDDDTSYCTLHLCSKIKVLRRPVETTADNVETLWRRNQHRRAKNDPLLRRRNVLVRSSFGRLTKNSLTNWDVKSLVLRLKQLTCFCEVAQVFKKRKPNVAERTVPIWRYNSVFLGFLAQSFVKGHTHLVANLLQQRILHGHVHD